MIYVAIISVLITVMILIRFLFLKKEIRRVTEQLQERSTLGIDRKISLAFSITI